MIDWYLDHVEGDGMFFKNYLDHHAREYQFNKITCSGCVSESAVLPFAHLLTPLSRNTAEWEKGCVEKQIIDVLERCAPYPEDDNPRFPIDAQT